MNYFKVLGIIFGLVALLKPVYMHLLPWDENTFIEKFYSEKRPPWIIPMWLIGLGLVALTWYLHFTLNVPNSIYIAVLFSLTALKGLTLLFDYSRFQKMVCPHAAERQRPGNSPDRYRRSGSGVSNSGGYYPGLLKKTMTGYSALPNTRN